MDCTTISTHIITRILITPIVAAIDVIPFAVAVVFNYLKQPENDLYGEVLLYNLILNGA